MTYLLPERTRERTVTTGTGTIHLGGVIFPNERPFSDGLADGDTTRYCLLSGNGVDWEIGDAAAFNTGSPNTLARSPIKSSNANAPINLVGDSQVYICLPAQTYFTNSGAWNASAAISQNTVVQFGDKRYVATAPIAAAPAGPPTIDGHAKHNGATSASPITATLTTTLADDLIVVLIAINGGQTAAPTAAGLAFTERNDGVLPLRFTFGGFTIQEFTAPAAAALTAKVITITPSASADFSAVAFGVNNVNPIFPFDTNSDHLPLGVAGNTIDCTTDGFNLFLIYADISATLGFNETAVPSGFTLTEGCNFVPAQMGVAGRSVSTQQVGVSLVGSATAAILSFVDALTSENAPPNVDPRWVPLGADFGDQAANTVYAGPVTGGAGPSGFRALVSADLPGAATMAAHTFKGNNTGSASAPLDLTATQLTAEINVVVGDSGSGGTKGLAPAPAAGDAAAGKFLSAGGGYLVPTGSGLSSALTSAHILVGNGSNVATDVAVSGDVTLANTGAYTIVTHAVTNSKMAQMAAHTFKGNNTGSTADALDLSATALTAELNAVVGDSGSGGTKGLVPAPAAGDAAAGKFLKADGTFAVPPGTSVSALTLISTQSAAGGVSSLDWTGLVANTSWRLVGRLLVPATGTPNLLLRFGTGGGPTWATASYDWDNWLQGGTFTQATGGEAQSSIQLNGASPSSSPMGSSFDLTIISDNSGWTRINGVVNYKGTDNHFYSVMVSGGLPMGAAALTGVRLLQSSGNIASGNASLYLISA